MIRKRVLGCAEQAAELIPLALSSAMGKHLETSYQLDDQSAFQAAAGSVEQGVLVGGKIDAQQMVMEQVLLPISSNSHMRSSAGLRGWLNTTQPFRTCVVANELR
jgi:hypothetical protein